MLRVLALSLISLITSCGAVSTPAAPPDLAGLELPDEVRSELELARAEVVRTPMSAAAWAGLGRGFEVHGLFAQAETCFVEAHHLEPDEARHPHRAARNAERSGAMARAIQWSEVTVALEPSYGPAWRQLGSLHFEGGDLAAARRAFERAAALGGTDPSTPGTRGAWVGLARVDLFEDRTDAALLSLERALDLAPDDAYVNLIYGTALRQAGRAEEAAERLGRGAGASPSWADPWSEAVERERKGEALDAAAAEAAMARKDYATAARLYGEVLERRPNDVILLRGCATAQSLGGEHDAALATLDIGLTRVPGSYDLSLLRATTLRTAGRRAEAWVALEDTLRLAPDRADAWLLRGALLRDRGDLEQALEAFREATRLEPSDLRGRLFQGAALNRLQRFAESVEALRPGLELAGARPSMPYFTLLAQALVASGRPDLLPQVLERGRELHGEAIAPLEQLLSGG